VGWKSAGKHPRGSHQGAFQTVSSRRWILSPESRLATFRDRCVIMLCVPALSCSPIVQACTVNSTLSSFSFDRASIRILRFHGETDNARLMFTRNATKLEISARADFFMLFRAHVYSRDFYESTVPTRFPRYRFQIPGGIPTRCLLHGNVENNCNSRVLNFCPLGNISLEASFTLR